ncbi:hypothetical protein [Motiliproteus sp. SC1-56]|uniref:hypothetical protein n=1 Tax=Motiliproteus sp. SC1-56 TaxID=2799565 RepID=UPI001A8DBBBE|nr:hypothetical protein [Motiliproteus sp. SC1-56]
MPYQVEHWAESRILYVRSWGEITPEDRRALLAEALALAPGVRRLLVDGREVTSFLNAAQTQDLAQAYHANSRSINRIALLHRPSFNPYPLLSSQAVIDGVTLEEFTDLDAAKAWLLGTQP